MRSLSTTLRQVRSSDPSKHHSCRKKTHFRFAFYADYERKSLYFHFAYLFVAFLSACVLFHFITFSSYQVVTY